MESLPNEILIKILRLLSTFDLVQFCQAYEHLDYFLREKDIIWHSDWSRRFELHDLNICRFISTKMNLSLIKVLNINYIFWISSQELRKLIVKLNNLEELQAIDTKLGLRKSDILAYNKLKKLAVGVEDKCLEPFECTSSMSRKLLCELKYLYLKIYIEKSQYRELVSYFIFNNTNQLEELWIQDYFEAPQAINFQGLVVRHMNSIKRVVIRSNRVLPIYDFMPLGLTKVFECKKYNAASDTIFEVHETISSRPSIFKPKATLLEKAWDVFERPYSILPCGPKESKLLKLNENIVNIKFEELDFCHIIDTCHPKFVDAALDILRSPNSKGLKKLRFKNCIWQQRISKSQEEEDSRVVFKKRRRGVQSEPAINHPFQEIAQNINHLRELDIPTCSQCKGNQPLLFYDLLGTFENLKMLSITIPLLLDGSFLGEVFQKCKFLESLSIECATTNEKFLINLYKNLKKSSALRDFKLECKDIIIEKLLTSLSDINNRKLLRLVLKCDGLCFSQGICYTKPFTSFVENNPQLILFYLYAKNASKGQMSEINRSIYKYKVGKPWRIFYVKNVDSHEIPSAHYDLVWSQTSIAVVNFDEF